MNQQEIKFMDPRIDFAFKKIFGSEDTKEVMISFLESFLKLKGNKKLKDIEIKDPYQLPHVKALKTSILDVKCTDHRNVTYIVEMQTCNVKGFLKRVQYNLAKTYANQITAGKDYPSLNQVIAITIADFELFKEVKGCISCHKNKETTTGKNYLEQMLFYFAELPKFTKEEKDLRTSLDKWLYFIKKASELQGIPKKMNKEPFITAFEKAKIINMDKDEFEYYDKAGMAITDAAGAIEFALEAGLEQGIEKGVKKERIAMAKEMKKEGEAIEKIIKYTKLSEQEIKSL